MNKYIKNLLLGSYIWYLADGLFGPLYAVFAEKIGGDVLELTSAYAVFLIAQGMLTIMMGKMSDKHSKARLMMWGYIINTIATFAYLLVNNPFSLLLVQSLLGISLALSSPTWSALYTQFQDNSKSGEAWGLSQGGPSIIQAGSIIAGGFIVTFLGFDMLFIVMGILMAVSTIVQASILKLTKY